jgi:hypothetical protein
VAKRSNSHDDTYCLAVEAKWTEPPYETVQDWLKKDKSKSDPSNREEVLSGWLGLLTPDVIASSFFNCEYQMIHRAASARAAAANTAKRPSLAYFKFHTTIGKSKFGPT